jgi:YHS domain-containing protein
MKIRLKQDAVCGADVDPSHSGDETQFGGQTYYFCCRDCKEAFESSPSRYLGDPSNPSVSHLSNPTTARAFGAGHSGRNRGLSKARAGDPGGRRSH